VVDPPPSHHRQFCEVLGGYAVYQEFPIEEGMAVGFEQRPLPVPHVSIESCEALSDASTTAKSTDPCSGTRQDSLGHF
jgi:hypothetical protein